MIRKTIPAFLAALLLLLTGCAEATEPVISPVPTESAAPTPSPTALPELSPMAALLESICEDYDPAGSAMESKRRCEELLRAWMASGEDGESARAAAEELLTSRAIGPETLSEKLSALHKMASRLCASDAGLIRDPTGRNELPDAESANRLFEALAEGIAVPGNS